MASIIITDLYTRFNERQPIFDFMIKKEEFYINTNGVSVTEVDKSFTTLGDGEFFILNKNNKPIYFNGLYTLSVKMRKERGFLSNLMKVTFKDTLVEDNFVYDTYNVSFRGQLVGELTLSRLSTYSNGSNVLLYPFQSIKFSATYRVLNVNNLSVQYYGNSRINPNKNKGTIDINFNIKCFGDKELTQQINETTTMSVNLVNSGYIAASTTAGQAASTTVVISTPNPTTTITQPNLSL